MRTYGRVAGSPQWVEVTTDAQGNNDYVYVTTLCQVLQLSPNESPYYANYGIPANPSIIQQIFPDFYVARTQQQFAPYFASLTIAKQALPRPVYNVNVTTNQGVQIAASIPQ
jgi:hypothetical protein